MDTEKPTVEELQRRAEELKRKAEEKRLAYQAIVDKQAQESEEENVARRRSQRFKYMHILEDQNESDIRDAEKAYKSSLVSQIGSKELAQVDLLRAQYSMMKVLARQNKEIIRLLTDMTRE